MNSVMLIGRLTRDPEVRYTSGSQMAVARFSIAIDRPVRQGGERQTDFPTIVVFGRQAETCEKYLAKGRLVAIEGRIQTGRYQNRNGDTVYTTEVVANRVEFLDWGDRQGQGSGARNRNTRNDNWNQRPDNSRTQQAAPERGGQVSGDSGSDDIPAAFEEIEDDVPF
ncbi:MAG: single-stranded DNA-binding protein [Eubacteriales bacterium]|nr:single-stranded DNA-binding protein [Eubacteriales bacterium]